MLEAFFLICELGVALFNVIFLISKSAHRPISKFKKYYSAAGASGFSSSELASGAAGASASVTTGVASSS